MILSWIALGMVMVVGGIGAFIAWHALDPKLHAPKDPPTQP